MVETLHNFFTSFGHTEQRSSSAKATSDLSHMQQNLTPKPPFSLKKTNPVEVKEAMLKAKTNKATSYNNIPPRAIKESAEILCYVLAISWRIPGYLNNENSVKSPQFSIRIVA